jgi:hypothetical protein
MSACPDPAAKEGAVRRDVPAAPFLVLLLLLSPAAAPFPARAQDFSIRSFHADIEVRDDSSIRVTETIETEFHRPRHGIYRDIPFRYTDELGNTTVMPVRVGSVGRPDGTGWKYRVERTGETSGSGSGIRTGTSTAGSSMSSDTPWKTRSPSFRTTTNCTGT